MLMIASCLCAYTFCNDHGVSLNFLFFEGRILALPGHFLQPYSYLYRVLEYILLIDFLPVTVMDLIPVCV